MSIIGAKWYDSTQPQPVPWTEQNLATLRQLEAKDCANLDLHKELGQKRYPSQAEIREYVVLDARLAVEEGQMTVSEFEEWTGEEY